MKVLANLLIMISLVMAVLGAVTAYVPRLSFPDDRLVGLTLGSDAGKDASGKPIVPAKTKLNAEHLAQLRASGARHVRVLEFSLARWPGVWLFSAGTIGLFAGGMLARKCRSPRAATSPDGATSMDAARGRLAEIRAAVAEVRSLAASQDANAKSAAVVARIGAVQRDLIPAFLANRPVITAALGQARTAQVLERFAMGERSMNRAWSAAADGYTDELDETLGVADGLLGEAAARLGT